MKTYNKNLLIDISVGEEEFGFRDLFWIIPLCTTMLLIGSLMVLVAIHQPWWIPIWALAFLIGFLI